MRKIFIFMSIICFYYSTAQNENSLVNIIKNVDNQTDIDSLQLIYPELSIIKQTLSTGDKNLNKKINAFKENEIEMLADSSGYIKLLAKKTIKEFKVKYIFLDGRKISQKEIKNIQNKIYDELEIGKTFSEVANKYSMDPGSENGDLGWFPEGRMIKSFEKAIKEHKMGDIFEVSEPSINWFFIIFKNHSDRESVLYEYITISAQ